MRTAKEKKLNRLPDSIVNRMAFVSVFQPSATQQRNQLLAATNLPTVINRISGYDLRAHKFQKPPIGTSEKFRSIIPVASRQQPRKTIGENVVQQRRTRWAPGMSLYRAYFVPGGVDPSGTFLVLDTGHWPDSKPEYPWWFTIIFGDGSLDPADLVNPIGGIGVRGGKAGAQACKSLGEQAWKTISSHTDVATKKGCRKSGVSIQTKQINACTGEGRIIHTVLDDTGKVVDGPHTRPWFKPRPGIDD